VVGQLRLATVTPSNLEALSGMALSGMALSGMAFEPRITLITLGVSDMPRARAFYEALGFTAAPASQASVTFFQMGGMVLSLYGRAALAEDAQVADSAPGFAAVTIGYNCRSEAEVDAAIHHAVASGATLKKAAQKVFWGGYSGYIADPDGHLWEVAYNPFLPLDADGRATLPSA
jgi:uncharacterized protein